MFLGIACNVNAQIIPITKNQKFRKEFKSDRKALIEEGWDITPFPGEFPQDVLTKREFEAQSQTNWGKDLLLPVSIRARLVAECKNKVVIKIFDTAGKCTHGYLVQGQLPGSSFTGESSLEDGNGHGTHVAGIIVADKELGLLDALVDAGIITWKPVKVLGDNGSGSFTWIANGITTEAIDNKRLITSGTYVICTASLGGGTAKQTAVETALKGDVANGTIWTVAAGNSSGGPVNYPGNSVYVAAIGSLDNTNPLKYSSFESVGPEIWTGAPGRGINSTYKGNAFATLSGTSMATPFQAGLCAIALSKWGNKLTDMTAMKTYLAAIATDLETPGKDNYTGYGIDFVKAILDTAPGSKPNPDPDPKPPSHDKRNLLIRLEGSFKMSWNNGSNLGLDVTGNSYEIKPSTYQARNRRQLKSMTTDQLTVTALEIRINGSTNMAPIDYTQLVSYVNAYFKNRGLWISGNPDYFDAANWTSMFLELIFDTQFNPKLDVDVIRIEFKDKNGKTGVLLEKDLRHWN